MKGPIAACLHGIAALQHGHHAGRVVISGSVAEELAEGPALNKVIEAVQPDAVIICEPSRARVAVGQRGRAEVTVEARGACLRTPPTRRPGAMRPRPWRDWWWRCAACGCPGHAQLGGGLLVLTGVASEPFPSLSVVPDRCTASFDRRTLPGESLDDVLGPIRQIAGRIAAEYGVEFEVGVAVDDIITYGGDRLVATNFACRPGQPIRTARSCGPPSNAHPRSGRRHGGLPLCLLHERIRLGHALEHPGRLASARATRTRRTPPMSGSRSPTWSTGCAVTALARALTGLTVEEIRVDGGQLHPLASALTTTPSIGRARTRPFEMQVLQMGNDRLGATGDPPGWRPAHVPAQRSAGGWLAQCQRPGRRVREHRHQRRGDPGQPTCPRWHPAGRRDGRRYHRHARPAELGDQRRSSNT